jgi:hypothetical protein
MITVVGEKRSGALMSVAFLYKKLFDLLSLPL